MTAVNGRGQSLLLQSPILAVSDVIVSLIYNMCFSSSCVVRLPSVFELFETIDAIVLAYS